MLKQPSSHDICGYFWKYSSFLLPFFVSVIVIVISCSIARAYRCVTEEGSCLFVVVVVVQCKRGHLVHWNTKEEERRRKKEEKRRAAADSTEGEREGRKKSSSSRGQEGKSEFHGLWRLSTVRLGEDKSECRCCKYTCTHTHTARGDLKRPRVARVWDTASLSLSLSPCDSEKNRTISEQEQAQGLSGARKNTFWLYVCEWVSSVDVTRYSH